MLRKYTAVVDTEHDTFYFNYTSTSRNGSHKNLHDCMIQLLQCKGRHARYYRITDTYRNDWEN